MYQQFIPFYCRVGFGGINGAECVSPCPGERDVFLVSGLELLQIKLLWTFWNMFLHEHWFISRINAQDVT